VAGVVRWQAEIAMTPEATARLAVEIGIRRLHALCADAVWRKDRAAFVDCFAIDGEWKVAGMHLCGQDAIGEGFDQFLALNERVLMSFGSPILDIGQGVASGRTYTMEHVKTRDGQGMSSVGIYYERFVEQADEWRFQWRHFDFCYFGPPDLSAPLYAFVDYGRSPALPDRDAVTAGM
jgi:hypothetical protein